MAAREPAPAAAGADVDDVDDGLQHETPFEMVDHTAATAWERLVAAIEDVFHKWREAPATDDGGPRLRSTTVSYAGRAFVLDYVAGAGRRPPALLSHQAATAPLLLRHLGDLATDFVAVCPAHPPRHRVLGRGAHSNQARQRVVGGACRTAM